MSKTLEPIIPKKTMADLIANLSSAQAIFDQAVEDAKAATKAKGDAQEVLNFCVSALLDAYHGRNDSQMGLGELAE